MKTLPDLPIVLHRLDLLDRKELIPNRRSAPHQPLYLALQLAGAQDLLQKSNQLTPLMERLKRLFHQCQFA